MKKLKGIILLFIVMVLLLLLAPSCKKVTINQSPCNGNCDSNYGVVYKNQPIFINSNGYHEIEWDGLNYFQIKGQLTPLNEQYIINGEPLIEAKFDSDYWVVFDSIRFQTPMYEYLGWFTDQNFNSPISVGPHTYAIDNLLYAHSPHNIVGYQIPKHICVDCPYSETLLGTYSKYTYTPTQNIMLDNEMIGDTINIFIETTFNTDMGESEKTTDQIKVIII